MANWNVLDFILGAVLTDAQLDLLYENEHSLVENLRAFIRPSATASTGFEAPTSGTLSHTISGGDAIIFGYPVSKGAVAHTYTANKDTYVDIDNLGNYIFTEVPNDDPEPFTGWLRILKVVTDGTSITSVKNLAKRQILMRECLWQTDAGNFQIVVNTTTETQVFQKPIQGSIFETSDNTPSRKMIVRLMGKYENSSGGASDFTLRLKYGGITIGELTFTDSSHAGGSMHNIIAQWDFAFGEHCFGKMEVGPPLADATNPANSNAAAAAIVWGKYDFASIDWSTHLDMTITAQHSVANANTEFHFLHATIELI